uniref:Sb:cb470 n=1 Tax=Lates calcarifer TaxID=8187 RepID=A0A4W6EH25_LATCA
MRPPVAKLGDFIPLFNDCISAASSRTQEYLLFKDPENNVCLKLTDTFNCTAMTPEQRILLGADWVWAVLEKPTKNPQIQIAVQVLHLLEREDAEENANPPETCSESVQIAQKESSNKTMYERLVDFCASIGKDCYALFLFFGKKNDKENIYGVLSNNFEAAIGKSDDDASYKHVSSLIEFSAVYLNGSTQKLIKTHNLNSRTNILQLDASLERYFHITF